MADITIAQSDKGFYLNFTINDSAGTAYALSGYTIKLKVWLAGSTATVTGTCEIVVAASGTCRYLVIATDFVTAGIYQAEIELTKTGVIESTDRFTIEVKEST